MARLTWHPRTVRCRQYVACAPATCPSCHVGHQSFMACIARAKRFLAGRPELVLAHYSPLLIPSSLNRVLKSCAAAHPSIRSTGAGRCSDRCRWIPPETQQPSNLPVARMALAGDPTARNRNQSINFNPSRSSPYCFRNSRIVCLSALMRPCCAGSS